MTTHQHASRKRAPNANEQNFIEDARRIREGRLTDASGLTCTGNLRECAEELLRTFKEDGEPGFWTSYSALKADNPRMGDWEAAIRTASEYREKEAEPEDERLQKTDGGKLIFRTFTEDDIDKLPNPKCLVRGLLQEVAVSMFYGESNAGKTFLIIHLAQCVARGKAFFGRKVKPGKVLYIYAEGQYAIKLRLQAYRKHYDLPPTSNIEYICVPTHLIHDRQYLLDTVAEKSKGDTPIVLVIFDTYSMCTSEADQKDQKDVHQNLATAREIATQHQCHVAITHHTNKQGNFNGAQEFKNLVDTMAEVQVVSLEEKRSTLVHVKQRELAPFEKIPLRLEVIDLGIDRETLEPLSSCACVYDDSDSATTEGNTSAPTLPKEAVQMLEMLKVHGKLTTGTWQRLCEKTNEISSSAFYKHLKRITKEKLVNKSEAEKRGQKIYYTLSEEGEKACE